MESDERESGRRRQHREARKEFHRGHHAMLGADGASVLRAIRISPIAKTSKVREREWRARAVSAQPLALIQSLR